MVKLRIELNLFIRTRKTEEKKNRNQNVEEGMKLDFIYKKSKNERKLKGTGIELNFTYKKTKNKLK